jgi:hypothetical protein
MIRLAMAALAVTLVSSTGCARPWSESTGQPGFTERAPLVEPLASRIDRGGWMISDQARVWKVMESQSGLPERHIGYVVGANYRQVRGGPAFKMYKVSTLVREDQIGHVDSLGRAVRYVPQRDGTFRPEPVGTNELSESVAAIFGTMRHVRLAETSERRLAFEALDIDGNGLLVPSETAGFGEQMQAADSNGDGGVDFEEFELIDRL